MRLRTFVRVATACALLASAFGAGPALAAKPTPVGFVGVTGFVTSAPLGSAISGAKVTAWQYSGKTKSYIAKASTLTTASGGFALGVSAGTYRLSFEAVDYTTEYYNDAATVANAVDVAVPAGGSVTRNAQLTSPFLSGGVQVTQNDLDVGITWTAGRAPYSVYRSTNPTDATAWVYVGTTESTAFTDPASFRTPYSYRVVAANGQIAGPSGLISLAAGYGTPDSPYLVRSLDDLNNIRHDLGAHYRQIADIDASSTATWNGGEGWVPIGIPGVQFTGTYDGYGHTITRLTAVRSAINYQGLFGCILNATIKNTHVRDAFISAQYASGAITGNMISSTIIDCSSSGTISSTLWYHGGIVGSTGTGPNIIEGCTSTVSVTGYKYVGGIVGALAIGEIRDCTYSGSLRGAYSRAEHMGGIAGDVSESVVSSCSANATIQGQGNLGGIIGTARVSVVRACEATSSINSWNIDGDNIGGLVGYADSTIERCSAHGSIRAFGTAGGLSGVSYRSISDCYADVSVTCSGDTNRFGYVGGLCGVAHGTIDRSIATGLVIADNSNPNLWLTTAGGLVAAGTVVATESYFDTLTTGQTETGIGMPKTTFELQTLSTYPTPPWDFTTVWNEPVQGVTYPTLR